MNFCRSLVLEPAERQFLERVGRLAHDIAVTDVLACKERGDLYHGTVAHDIELGELIALLHRRADRRLVGHGGLRAVLRALGQEQVDTARKPP